MAHPAAGRAASGETSRTAGTLFVVPTPIGNLEDITLRALRVLREVAVVAAEDTRRTRHLLTHYNIGTPLVSLHAHNEHARIPAVLARLQAGESVALVSDAGTPGASDPGMQLVRSAQEAGCRVEALPGASAVLTALSASGWRFDQFLFLGFAPSRSKDRRDWAERVCCSESAVVFFEAPHRIAQTLRELSVFLGDRQIMVGRELTKHFEQTLFGSAEVVLAALDSPRGEFTVVVSPREPAETAVDLSEADLDATVASMIGQTTEHGSRREALRSIATTLHLPMRTVYAAAERLKAARALPDGSADGTSSTDNPETPDGRPSPPPCPTST